MKPYVIGTHKGQDLHAFEVQIAYSRAALARLADAIILHGLRVGSVLSLHTPPQSGDAVWLSVSVPAHRVESARAVMVGAVWAEPSRPAAGSSPPTPTWGELRDQVQALLSTHKGPHLPCGHPVATLVFDSVDGAQYTCPLCKQQQAEEGAN